MKKISVITPCYNSYEYLDTCFDSLIHQTIGLEHMEMIFVNDASTDDTGEKLNQYESFYPDSIIVIHLSENKKQGGARNVALSYASGEYVVFIDSDDWVAADYLQKVYDTMKNNDADMLQIPFMRVPKDGDITKGKKTPVYWNGLYEINDTEKRKYFLTRQLFNCGAPNKIYKRELLLNSGAYFLENVAYEEPSFVYPLFFYVKRIYMLDGEFYYYRTNDSGTMNSYITKPGKLYDHPFVQLSVYKQLRRMPAIYSVYKDEIDYYFLFTFYIETLFFAKMGNLYLGYDFFLLMQSTVKSLIPDFKENPYVNSLLKESEKTALVALSETFSEKDFEVFFKNLKTY